MVDDQKPSSGTGDDTSVLRAVVVDASIGVTLTQQEAQSGSAREALAALDAAGLRFVVPALFWLEVVNALRRRGTDAETITESVYELRQLGLESRELDEPLLLLTIDLVVRHRLTAYDALYLALAEATGARLLTADANLAAAAPDRTILVRADTERRGEHRGAHETAVAYDFDRPAADTRAWPGAAAYLTRLRESARWSPIDRELQRRAFEDSAGVMVGKPGHMRPDEVLALVRELRSNGGH